jgi:hypothetical protein
VLYSIASPIVSNKRVSPNKAKSVRRAMRSP